MEWRIESLERVASTNDAARERALAAWAGGQSAHGLVVTADRQSGGRGQHGRAWESPKGGLYLTAVVEHVPPDLRDRLALVAGVATADALDQPSTFFSEAGVDAATPTGAQLRWPNDLVLADKKVAGILCESIAQGPQWAAIIGIGINVLTDPGDFSPAIRPHATSLFAHDRRLRTLTGILDAVLNALEAQCHSITAHGLGPTLEKFRPRDALRNRHLLLQLADPSHRTLQGTAAGLNHDGHLLLQTSSGVVTIANATLLEIDGRPK